MGRGKTPKRTDETAKQVKILAIAGIPQAQIAKLIGVGKNTLPKLYRAELDAGGDMATATVAASLYQNALKGNVTAQIFWLKTRGGWRETDRNEQATPQSFEFVFRETGKGERIKVESAE